MKYCIGIDLGTTNSVVAYTPLTEETLPRDHVPEIKLLSIPQVVFPGQIECRPSLPSFLYLPREGELDSLSIDGADFRPPSDEATAQPATTSAFPEPAGGVVGVYARDQAAENPQRVVVAAKSWLCHNEIGRTAEVLPWQSPPEVPKVSAVQCTIRLLSHLVAAWHSQFPDAPIDQQHVVLTVPASFDPAARELTRQAAIAAGLHEQFVLLEEPQAAVYRYLASTEGDWREEMSGGDVLLVVDVGGGTTDLTLVTIDEEDGDLNLQRLAVGNHLLVGGDNMDLALAYHATEQLRQQGHDLDPWQSTSLWHACRNAKEQLLAQSDVQSVPISVLGRGSSLIGGTITTELRREDATRSLTDGFFPPCTLTERPESRHVSGFQDIGLPYESDPAITKQVAAFLQDHLDKIQSDGGTSSQVTHLLFNGGVFRSSVLRERMEATIGSWFDQPVTTVGGPENLDTAVAIGAAFYGFSKQRGGIRIRGGTAKAYYVGIETAGLAIPGAPRPLRAVCVAPQGMEEGTQVEVPGEQVGLVVGKPARFRFFSSTTRMSDQAGKRLDRIQPEELQESEPIELTLETDPDHDQAFVPVQFEARVTELGMLELWCHSVQDERRWKMEFNAREKPVTQ